MEENKEVQPSPEMPEQAPAEMPEMENKPSQGKKKGGLLKLIIALVVIGAIAAVVVLGAQGGWFQGSMFSRGAKLKTVAPIETVKQAMVIEEEVAVPITKEADTAIAEKEMIIKEVDRLVMEEIKEESAEVITTMEVESFFPADPYWGYLDRAGPGASNYFDDDWIYQEIEPPTENDVLMVFRLYNAGDAYFDLYNLGLYNNIEPIYSDCSRGIASKWDRCDTINKLPVGAGSMLYELVLSSSGGVDYVVIVAEDSNIDGIFSPNEFRHTVRVNGKEEKRFAVVKDTTYLNGFPFGNPDTLSGWVTPYPASEFIFKDGQGNILEPKPFAASEQGNPQYIRFR